MIRPFTCVCLLLACGSGLYVYQTKHRAQELDREVGRTIKLTEAARERVTALRAEWALLNEPERLSELSRQYLNLHTLAPSQFVTLADLGAKLPAVLPPGSFTPPPSEDDLPAPVAEAPPLHVMAPAGPAPIVQASVSPPAGAAPSAPTHPVPTRARPVDVAAPRPPIVLAQASAPPATYPTPLNPPLSTRPPILSQSLPPPSTVRPAASFVPIQSASLVPAPRISPAAPVLPISAPVSATPIAPYAGSAIGESVLRASALGGRPALPPPTPYTGR